MESAIIIWCPAMLYSCSQLMILWSCIPNFPCFGDHGLTFLGCDSNVWYRCIPIVSPFSNEDYGIPMLLQLMDGISLRKKM